MRIAVLSGKGGTGKTLVSVNLAAVADGSTYIDCDIEEPNGHLFFKPEILDVAEVTVGIPQVDRDLCDGCRQCVEFCRFNALAYTTELMVFDEICHSCGGCGLVCPQNALTEVSKSIGQVRKGKSERVTVYTGQLNIGEASGVPIIKKLLAEDFSGSAGLTIIDSPPGSACNVMETVEGADYCILVAEPTLFGVHNFSMVHELVELFGKPLGAVLNKCLDGEENPAELFCADKGIKVLARIPFDPDLGRINSNAEIAVRKDRKYRELFSTLLETVLREAGYGGETATGNRKATRTGDPQIKPTTKGGKS